MESTLCQMRMVDIVCVNAKSSGSLGSRTVAQLACGLCCTHQRTCLATPIGPPIHIHIYLPTHNTVP